MKQIKILRIVNSLCEAGLENGVKNFIANAQNYENVIVCLNKKMGDVSGLNQIRIYELKKIKGVGLDIPFKIAKIIREEKPHILQMHNMDPFQQGMLATIISDVPIKIYVDHNSFVTKTSKKAKMLSRILAKRLDRIIAVSDEVKSKLVGALGVEPDKIKVILNGTDTKKFDKEFNIEEIKSGLGLKKEEKIVTIVAGLRGVKDHMTLIKAFSIMVRKEKNAKLLIVGTGEEDVKKKIKSEIERNQLEEKVILLGLRRDIPEILSVTDVSVLSSLSEGTSQTIMESMAAGKPVVATNVGGNPVLVKNGINGYLVPPKNQEMMAEMILKLLKDKKLRDKMGKEGRKMVEEHFNIQRVIRDYESVYKELLKKKGAI